MGMHCLSECNAAAEFAIYSRKIVTDILMLKCEKLGKSGNLPVGSLVQACTSNLSCVCLLFFASESHRWYVTLGWFSHAFDAVSLTECSRLIVLLSIPKLTLPFFDRAHFGSSVFR